MAPRKKLVDEITPELKEQIENKISWEGLDYYLADGGYARDDFEGTILEPLLDNYLDARHQLLAAMSDLEIEV